MSKLQNFAEVATMEPLVDDVLSRRELFEIFFPDNSIRNQGVWVYKNATYTNWDGSIHKGAIVTVYKDGDTDDYFMERTFRKIRSENGKVYAEQVWHRLIPVNFKKNGFKLHKKCPRRNSGVNELCDIISHKSLIDDITVDYIKLSHTEATEQVIFDATPVNILEHERYLDTTKSKFIQGSVPAGDNLWDELLFGDLTEIRGKVFRELNKQGHFIKLDGEKDSFGWITCGIVMDGKLMTSQYF